MSKLKKVKAKKEDVKTSLSKSLDYCNSHHESAQAIFEEIVDKQITSDSKIINPEQRARDMKALFPILLQQEYETRIPSISMTADELPECSSDFRQFLELWFTRWVDKFTKEWKSLPSEGEAKPKKAVTDRALVRLVSSSGHAGDIEEQNVGRRTITSICVQRTSAETSWSNTLRSTYRHTAGYGAEERF